MKLSNYVLGLAVVVALTACGGGGGNPGTTSDGAGAGAGAGTGTGTGTGTTTSAPTVVASVVDASGASVTGISLATGFLARATVKDANGAAVIGKLVTFEISGASIAVLSPTTALTTAPLGIAEVAIAPASVSSIGAATLSASADFSGVSVPGTIDFAVQSSSLALSAVTVTSASLPSAGNTPVQVTALISGAPAVGVPVNVSFNASCGKINGQDTTSGGVSVTTNGSGVASAVYDAVAADGSLCSGSVTLTGSSAGAVSQSKTISVAVPTASAVVFMSATPAQIFVAGSGALDQAIVKFRVLSSGGSALPSVPVKLSIVTNPGGVGLGSAGVTAPVTVTTLVNGEASVSVFSGTIPGPVKVRAELASDPLVFSESQNLTVASGPPSQRFMSLSVETFNIEGWSIDGASTQLTVRIADRQGNAVDDGTVINFTAEGGQVARSCATVRVNGVSQCSVTFISQNPRPAGGRASVLAYIAGTKDYVDINGNNTFDAGDTLLNIGDAYRDDNENGIYENAIGEFVVPRNGTSVCAGAGAPFPARVNTCDANLATTVRQQAVILFSSTNPVFDPTSVSTGSVSFKLRSSTNTLLPLPAGTTFTAQATDSNTTDGFACAVDQTYGTPVPNVQPGINPNVDIASSGAVTLKNCRAGDSVTITVTVPSGLKTTFFANIP
ncbi:MAG: hypothetical protein GZ093_10110 [Rhodoferax sp.]|uniref:hypothetical protein n=1 Tax=Rhodoferax sp. TaxID=50421 RepID=UPI001400BD56|nr:hypothetical protein [Rhodoferax sp.]NDP39083.1 hypothetical protein [Rhodoferax sp.]